MMSKEQQNAKNEKEWKRAIPEAGYIKLGTLRYGVRISNPILSDYSPTNKSRHSSLSSNSSLGQPSSLIMSPSSGSTTTKSICNDSDDCCCIGGSGTGLKIWQNNNQHANSTSTKTRLPILNSAKNRTSSPSSTSSQQPTNISSNKSSVSSSNLKRETSPTVCCYYINNSHSNRDAKSCQKARENNKNSANQVNCNRTNNNNNNNSNNNNSNNNNNNNNNINNNNINNNNNSNNNNINNNNNNNCEQYHNEYNANDRKRISASDRNEQLTRNISNNENGEREQSENCENGYSYLKDKIRKFENTTNNHQNIKNRTTTTSSGVCGVSREINEYKNSCNEFQINRDESRLKAPSSECSLVSDSNNNNIIKVSKLQVSTPSDSANKSSFNVKQQRDTKDSNFVNDVDDVKLTKVVILNKISAHGVSNHKQSAPNKQTKVPKQNSLDDNDFSFIDSSSNELSVSSSSSFASDDLRHDLSDAFDKINHKKFSNRIPKINKSHYTKSSVDSNKVCEFESGVTESVCDIRYRKFNNGTLVDNHENNTNEKFLKLSPDNSTSSLNCFSRSNYQIYERISPDKTIIMEKHRRNTLDKLQKLGFGRKSSSTSSSATTSPDTKTSGSKTERLRELTEKLKGHKSSSSSQSSNNKSSTNTVTPPPPPPLPPPPIPPPRRFKRNSGDLSAAPSIDNLSCSLPIESSLLQLQNNSKSRIFEPSNSIFNNAPSKSIVDRFLRPNISASNLESMCRPKDYLTLDQTEDSISLQDDDFFTKFTRPESRTIVGSYIQKSIPFRSASFSQVDFTSGKYVRSDLSALKASLINKNNNSNINLDVVSLQSDSKDPSRCASPAKSLYECDDKKCFVETMPTNMNKYPLKSEMSITLEAEGKDEYNFDTLEIASKRNSDIETIDEEPIEEILAELTEQHEQQQQLERKLSQINVVQANEMTLETLIEEETPLIAQSSHNQCEELQTATTCLIPIPVFECVEKEWSPLPDHGGEEFCQPISEEVLQEAKVIENVIEIRLNETETDLTSVTLDKELSKNNLTVKYQVEYESNNEDDNSERVSLIEELNSVQNIPEVELNNVAIQLDEITEKLAPTEEVSNIVKTQIPQSKEDMMPRKSAASTDDIRISPEIQEVLTTVAETLIDGTNVNINIVSLICPDNDLSSSDRGTPEGSKLDLLKTESSPEPNSFDKSDSEFVEVRKRHSNNEINSGSDKSSPNASPNANGEEKKRIDKSRRRKGIYIQWPAVEKSNDLETDSIDNSTPEESNLVPKNEPIDECAEELAKNKHAHEKKRARSHNLGFSFSTPPITRQSDSLCSLEPCTPESDNSHSNKSIVWPKPPPRRQSLTYQSSDERDDPLLTSSPPLKPFRNLFLRSDSISDNESERGSSRDRTTASPAPNGDQDLRRYSKRPLRGPYGQMLEKEMKKPTKVHYDGILEELSRSDSYKKSNCSLDESHGGFFSRNKTRKSGGNLPVPMHQRTVSSPVPLIETTCPDALPIHHKKYPSNIDHRVTDNHERISFKQDLKKLSLDSCLLSEKSPKRTSSDISDKHSKKNPFSTDKIHQKRSLDEMRLSSQNSSQTASENSFILMTPETPVPKSIAATPELLAELLKGSSEKQVNENQNKKHQHQHSIISSTGIALPTAVLKCLDTRTHVVVELFNTEKSYVESLQTVVLKYLNPLKLPENSMIVDSQIVDEIFFMVPSILNVHERFLDELKKRLDCWDSSQKVGDAYFDVFSKPQVLETYTSFVNNWNKAKDAIRLTKTTRPAFAKFLEAMSREHKGKLSLDNLLIKPVQKFPNYELIFQRLIKHTDADHPDQKPLQEALKLVHDILVHLNCKEREALENGQREATLRELEGVIEGMSDLVTTERTFLLFELVSMPSGQATRKERGFFLFNDLLVITSIKRRGGTIRKPNTVPGSITSTLDTNKYKFLTKISLDDLEIVKSKDENVRRIMREIEILSDDSSKIQQISEISSNLRCPHQVLEDSIRDLQRDIQRQLAERQANDTQLNLLELNLNVPSGTQNMSIVFVKPDKRAQWEEAFTEAKQKLIASIERYQLPEFIASVPIRKTRAGLQFTCASPTLGTQKDVWVCNSDGYVGQVCVLSLNSVEPTVTSCNGVCNARILCVTSVPASPNITPTTSNNLNSSINLSMDETSRLSLLSISNSSTHSNKTIGQKSCGQSDSSNIQLDSSSSSDDSEPEIPPECSNSPSLNSSSASHQTIVGDDSENQQSTMWLGTEDGCIHVYNCTDNIRIKKNKIKIQHVSAVSSILYLDNRVFVSLANGDICVYVRDNSGWNTQSPLIMSIGTVTSPITKLLNVYGKLWCAIQGIIKILNTSTLQVENQIQISCDAKPISHMAVLNNFVWISVQNSATITCCNVINFEIIYEVNLAPSVNKMLSSCDDIIRQHKAACLRVTSLLACKDIIWVGTSAGVLLTILAQNVGKSSSTPIVTGIPHGHTGHVRFLTSVDINNSDDDAVKSKKIIPKCLETPTKNGLTPNINSPNQFLIISGGDGYEDFRTTGSNSTSDVAGREDSTNHLLLFQM